jgi:hypothetical protein
MNSKFAYLCASFMNDRYVVVSLSIPMMYKTTRDPFGGKVRWLAHSMCSLGLSCTEKTFCHGIGGHSSDRCIVKFPTYCWLTPPKFAKSVHEAIEFATALLLYSGSRGEELLSTVFHRLMSVGTTPQSGQTRGVVGACLSP